MVRQSVPAVIPKKQMTASEAQRGIERLKKCVDAIEEFSFTSVNSRANPPEVTAVEVQIKAAIEKTFGEGTADYKLYTPAAQIAYKPVMWSNTFPSVQDFSESIRKSLERSKVTILQAISSLQEDIEEMDLNDDKQMRLPEPHGKSASRKVFIVHGHDEGARESVARFLERLGYQAIILHEHANRGGTLIEKFEANSDVGFVVVLLTPDDAGGKVGASTSPRARQNVVLEWGYFIGRLGRNRVCALRKGDVELPSDIQGIVWELFDDHGAWKGKLAKELEAAGFTIEWAKVHS